MQQFTRMKTKFVQLANKKNYNARRAWIDLSKEYPFDDLMYMYKLYIMYACIPMSSAVVERGFSLHKMLKRQCRSTTNTSTIDAQMRIKLELSVEEMENKVWHPSVDTGQHGPVMSAMEAMYQIGQKQKGMSNSFLTRQVQVNMCAQVGQSWEALVAEETVAMDEEQIMNFGDDSDCEDREVEEELAELTRLLEFGVDM